MDPVIRESEIVAFLKANIRLLDDSAFGPRYRASVRLTDRTALACVVFQSARRYVELARLRFDEARRTPDAMGDVVRAFVASGSTVSSNDIASVASSPFALDIALLQQIRGETSMGWTGFDAVLRDGRRLTMGTTFSFDFFELPLGCTADDVVKIEQLGHPLAPGLPPYIPRPESGRVYRELPFFTCYIDDL